MVFTVLKVEACDKQNECSEKSLSSLMMCFYCTMGQDFKGSGTEPRPTHLKIVLLSF